MKALNTVVKSSLFRLGALDLARRRGGGGNPVRVLRYHSVSEAAPWRAEAISVSPRTFAAQMRFVAANYSVVDLDAVLAHLETGASLPPRPVVVTFDDGYVDNHDHALPILRDLNLTATFFITAGPVVRGEPFWVGWVQELAMTTAHLDALVRAFDLTLPARVPRQKVADALTALAARRSAAWRDAFLEEVAAVAPDAPPRSGRPSYMMTPDHMIALHDAGMTIGAHTVTHPILSAQDDATTRAELADSRRLLEEVLNGVAVRHLAYPNAPGVLTNYDDRTRVLARQAGFATCGTSQRGVVERTSDPFALPRLGIHHGLDDAAFAFRLEEHRFRGLLHHR